ncbi:MAG: hypothetical protein ACXW6R_05645, partial [Candidatus Binatia bacterium]
MTKVSDLTDIAGDSTLRSLRILNIPPDDTAVDLMVRSFAQMASATIKLFLPRGDAKSLRTAEISNWTGKAVAAPRTELDVLLQREELDKSGVYILIGTGP